MPEGEELHATRPGSTADISRRVDRLERNLEELSRDFAQLTGTVNRVEANQNHAEELNKLRFTALDTSVSSLSTDLKGFMARVEALITGEADTAASREGRALVADYHAWRREIQEQVDANTDRISQTDAVALALTASRQSTGVWVRSVVPWVLSGIGLALTVVNLLDGWL